MTAALSQSPVTLGGLNLSQVEDSGVEWTAETLDGWGSPKGTLTVTQRPRSHGGWGGNSFLTPRVVAISGWVSGPTAVLVSDAIDRLIAACSLDDTTLSVSESGRVRSCMVRRQDDVLVTWMTATLAQWSIQVVAEDPRKYGALITASTHLPASVGGLRFPFRFPLRFPAVVTSGQIGVNNPGNIKSPLRLRIDGPCTGPIVTHQANGKELVFSSDYTIAAGNWLDIDMGKRTVLENGQASRNGSLTSRGWFDLDPGLNTVGFNATVYDADSLLTLYCTPAWA